MIEFQQVTKAYPDGTVAVDSLSFTAQQGEITVLVGPSGCGKTTTLRMMNRLIEPTSGTILLGGADARTLEVTAMRRSIGYVIQSAGLFPHRTVLDNIRAVPMLERRTRAEARGITERAHELLSLVGLDEQLAQKYPWQLSGGQQQRVGVARALAADPPYLLLDEPFSAVDPLQRTQLQDELLAIQRQLAKTMVMVTHDIDEALKLGDHIIVMREGAHIAQQGAPAAITSHPANDFVAEFIGRALGR